jgi:3-deoxy-manno-octulosonate cytidylyltransferase (CMP-KDO synthetase)
MAEGRHRVVAIIPARYGSTRLPGKPLVDLAGKPMIQRVYERTRQARLVGRVVVATDDRRVAEAVHRFGGTVELTPGDLRSGSDRVAFVAKAMNDAAIVVNVQGDEPLIEPAMIDEVIKPVLDEPSVDVGTLVRRIENAEEPANPNIVKVVIDAKGFAMYFSRSPIPYARNRQSAAELYKHIGLYVYRRDFLMTFASLPETTLERTEQLEQLRVLEHGYRMKTVVTEYDSIPVDTPADVEMVRRLLQEQTLTDSP